MEGFSVAMLVGMVQGRFFRMFKRMPRKAVGCIAVVSRLLVVALLQVLLSSAVLLGSVLEVVSGPFVGLDDFLVFFGMVSHG
ncbi:MULTISPECIES: hypothetical protein [Hymenobacter]|nr:MULTISPECIES: hypothetical protein [Hymenobacter]